MAIGGAAGAGTSSLLANQAEKISKSVGDTTGSSLVGNIAANVVATVGGALVGGSAGAAAASNVDLYNAKEDKNRGEDQKEIADLQKQLQKEKAMVGQVNLTQRQEDGLTVVPFTSVAGALAGGKATGGAKATALLPAAKPGVVVANAMNPTEISQANDIVAMQGGKFVGAPTNNYPGIDGWIDGVPASLKSVTGNGMNAVQRNIVTGANQMSKAGEVGNIYVDATRAGVNVQDVTKWAQPGTPISNVLNEGAVNNIVIKTLNGWVNLTKSTIATPPGGRK